VKDLKENFQDAKIEPDSAAMNIIKYCDSDEHLDLVENEIEYVAEQVKACPRDKETRFILTYGLIAPEYLKKRLIPT